MAAAVAALAVRAPVAWMVAFGGRAGPLPIRRIAERVAGDMRRKDRVWVRLTARLDES